MARPSRKSYAGNGANTRKAKAKRAAKRTVTTTARKGRGAPGKPKSAAHRAAIAKALKAYHAKKGGTNRKRAKLARPSARVKHTLRNLKNYRKNAHKAKAGRGRRKSSRTKASMRARYYKNRAGSKPSTAKRGRPRKAA